MSKVLTKIQRMKTEEIPVDVTSKRLLVTLEKSFQRSGEVRKWTISHSSEGTWLFLGIWL